MRERFVIENKLCFSCLNSGHLSRECKSKKSCEICQGGHPTNMHRTVSRPEDRTPTIPITACASRSGSKKTPRKSSMVLPVRISHSSNPERELILYAMLDTQSDCSFITEGATEAMELQGVGTRLSLSTMTASDKIVNCQRYEGLRVQGLTSDRMITLPSVFSRRKIPINHQHIPCPEMVEGWTHLEHLRDKIAPRLNVEVGLLLGYDCPKGLDPKDVVSAPESGNGPFGMRTELGWGIVGIISPGNDDCNDLVGVSHRVATEQVTGSQIVIQRRTREIASPAECIRVLE